uniref:Uncharacterized protein n=1 Tax=Micrurus lemniscatus lemniscatus TaxID=129467 RepID=A0A2D4JAS8_MICLE
MMNNDLQVLNKSLLLFKLFSHFKVTKSKKPGEYDHYIHDKIYAQIPGPSLVMKINSQTKYILSTSSLTLLPGRHCDSIERLSGSQKPTNAHQHAAYNIFKH